MDESQIFEMQRELSDVASYASDTSNSMRDVIERLDRIIVLLTDIQRNR